MREFDESCILYSHANYDFFDEQVVPRVEKVGRRQISRPTAFRQVRASTYAYVRGGSGQVDINGICRPVSRGTFITFLNYHLYRYLPDSPLDVSYCCLLNGSVCTFFNNPYFPHAAYKTLLDEPDPIWQMDAAQIEVVEPLWDAIGQLDGSRELGAEEEQLYLLMEILGYQSIPRPARK